jgi:hypothetical protein
MKFKARVSVRVDGSIELEASDADTARKFLESMNPQMDQALFAKHIRHLQFSDELERLRIESLEEVKP